MEQQVNDNAGGDNQAEAKTYTAEQFRGLLADKQTEVRKRQEAERRASDLESQLAALTAGRTQGQASGQEQPAAAAVSDEDRLLTMSDLVRILREQGQADEASQAVRKGGRVAGYFMAVKEFHFAPLRLLQDRHINWAFVNLDFPP